MGSNGGVCWFEDVCPDVVLSDLGRDVANIVDASFHDGLSGVKQCVLHKRTEWNNSWKIILVVPDTEFGKDGYYPNAIRYLIFHCVKRAVSMAIRGVSSWGHVALAFERNWEWTVK